MLDHSMADTPRRDFVCFRWIGFERFDEASDLEILRKGGGDCRKLKALFQNLGGNFAASFDELVSR